MRNRIFVVLAIAVLAGGGLAYGTYNMVNNQPVKTVSTPTQPVVVAASNLQLGAELKAEDLKVIAFPQGQAPEGTFAQPSEIVGRGLIVPIVENEPVLTAKLASKEAGSGLPPVIPEGMRAVSVRVNEVVGVAGYVLPGNRGRRARDREPDRPALRHDDEGDSVERAGADRRHAHGAGPGEGKPMQVTVVTLLVFPEQAERLALASTEGKIQLALRNPLDQGAPETPGIKTGRI